MYERFNTLPPTAGVNVALAEVMDWSAGHETEEVKVPVPGAGLSCSEALAVVPLVIATVVEPAAMMLFDASRPFTEIVHEPTTRLLNVNDPVEELVLASAAPLGPLPVAVYVAMLVLEGKIVLAAGEVLV